jgi:hypothetical protein
LLEGGALCVQTEACRSFSEFLSLGDPKPFKSS